MSFTGQFSSNSTNDFRLVMGTHNPVVIGGGQTVLSRYIERNEGETPRRLRVAPWA